MSIQKWGGVAAIAEASIYLFGFVLFFTILDPSGFEANVVDEASGIAINGLTLDVAQRNLLFMIQNRDSYFIGYLVCGVVFSFTLLILVQAIYQRFKQSFPELMIFAAAVGYLWVGIVLASSLIFLIGLGAITHYYGLNPEQALTIHRTLSIVVEALGGGIELVGAVWVLAVSYVGLKSHIFSPWLHYWGMFVGISGVLTLFSGLSFLSTQPLFEFMTAIFGLGQILWFLVLGIGMLSETSIAESVSYIED
ncbi:hypothetical protein [Shewanella surugensis]|uniref:DUF4386 domain-containing protein n=1 Tax=Shewanella surugensis TaxID=212020 RepID=A0ABT0L727_9GAMM|nr:hypothetical protein [Shewanella surugensis]MCL1123369.1 hypothetical protein [Shewanella surugensis]